MGVLTQPHLQEASSGNTDRLNTNIKGTKNKPQAHL